MKCPVTNQSGSNGSFLSLIFAIVSLIWLFGCIPILCSVRYSSVEKEILSTHERSIAFKRQEDTKKQEIINMQNKIKRLKEELDIFYTLNTQLYEIFAPKTVAKAVPESISESMPESITPESQEYFLKKYNIEFSSFSGKYICQGHSYDKLDDAVMWAKLFAK